MPCKIQIRKNLKEGLEQKAGTIAHLNLEDANKKADNLNQIMGERLLYFTMNGDFMDSNFNEPSDRLVQIYYDHELMLEAKEIAKLIKEGNIVYLKEDKTPCNNWTK